MKVTCRPSVPPMPSFCPRDAGKPLYRMARQNCPHVFPDYDARFQYPGKTGQAKLFQALGPPIPAPGFLKIRRIFSVQGQPLPMPVFPWSSSWIGGVRVIRFFAPVQIRSGARPCQQAKAYERSGQRGFVLQTVVCRFEPDPAGGRDRADPVSLTGEFRTTPFTFGTSVAKGARIDTNQIRIFAGKGWP
jgi:ribosomal protein S6--L-glutamate ligase